MPDRRKFLRGVIGAPLGLAFTRRHVDPPDGRMQVVARQPEGFIAVDPRTGESDPVVLPAGTQRVHAHQASGSLFIELVSGALRIRRPGDSRGDVEVHPVTLGSPPLVMANRVVGRAGHAPGVCVHDLMSGEADAVPDDQLPGEPGDWRVHEHPVLPAAVIDARAAGGGVVLLPAGEQSQPRIIALPPESSIGIAPSGNDIVRIDHIAAASAVACGLAGLDQKRHDPVPYLMLGVEPAQVLGPVGGSDKLLLTVGSDWLPMVACQDAHPWLVDEITINDADAGSTVGHWQSSPAGDTIIVELTGVAGSAWGWWTIGQPPRMLRTLPVALQPGMATGCASQWFHGAVLTETSLGAGELRLMTINMENSEVVFDQFVDRRLELAATGVSADGSLLAHCQSGNAEVELLVTSFGDAVTSRQLLIDIADAPVAAAHIALDVIAAEDAGVVAAGLRWGNPDHHAPMVVMTAAENGSIGEPVRVHGELIGIIPFR